MMEDFQPPQAKKPRVDESADDKLKESQSILRSTCECCSKLRKRCDGAKPSCGRCSELDGGLSCFYSINVKKTSQKTCKSQKFVAAFETASKPKLACQKCRSRKRKCDGNTPSCSSCLRAGATCTYVLPEKRKGASILFASSSSSDSLGLDKAEAGYLVVFLQTFEELVPAFNWQLYADASFALAKEGEQDKKEQAERDSDSDTPKADASPASTDAYRIILWTAVGYGAALAGNPGSLEKYSSRVTASLERPDSLDAGDLSDSARLHALFLFDLQGDSVGKGLLIAALREKLERGQLSPHISAAFKVWEVLGGLRSSADGTGQAEEICRRVKASGQEHYLTIQEWKGYNLKVKNLVVGMLHLVEQISLMEESSPGRLLKGDQSPGVMVQQLRTYLTHAVQASDIQSRKSETSDHILPIADVLANAALAAVDLMFFPTHHAATAVRRCELVVGQLRRQDLQNSGLPVVPLVWHQLDILGYALWRTQRFDAYHALAALRNPLLPHRPNAKPFLPATWMTWQAHTDHTDVQKLICEIDAGFEAAELLPKNEFDLKVDEPQLLQIDHLQLLQQQQLQQQLQQQQQVKAESQQQTLSQELQELLLRRLFETTQQSTQPSAVQQMPLSLPNSSAANNLPSNLGGLLPQNANLPQMANTQQHNFTATAGLQQSSLATGLMAAANPANNNYLLSMPFLGGGAHQSQPSNNMLGNTTGGIVSALQQQQQQQGSQIPSWLLGSSPPMPLTSSSIAPSAAGGTTTAPALGQQQQQQLLELLLRAGGGGGNF
mmetsp:Transcript_37328/g.54698  ORF Transcript_37328/g.54698 Transcript_37328/m.54698 type:complete len:780 (-) Transcript_37328:76-2415(-)